jgi:putative phosphoesterase
MKIFIASDLHGSFYFVNRLIDRFNAENGDLLILLGDILYHGPRNDLPKDYNPKKVIELLNSLSDKIVCVQGNCDAEVDGMVLNFEVLTPYRKLIANGITMHLTHGHKYNPENQLTANEGEVVLFGHSHIPYDKVLNGVRYINPGSISIPKENSHHGYMILENGVFVWKDFTGNEIMRYTV